MMDSVVLTLMSNAVPVLPGPGLLRVAMPVMWALVLAGCTLTLGVNLPNRWRLGLTLVVAVWALIPGPVSITFWLGLAFQMPSLTTVLICAGWLVSGLTHRHPVGGSPKRDMGGLGIVGWLGYLGIALGWLLLLDTLAVLPWSMYPFGFGVAALGVVSVVVAVLWTGAGERLDQGRRHADLALVALALLLFVVTRLPTGNLWDALIDPWLWVALQVLWLRRLLSRLVGQRRA